MGWWPRPGGISAASIPVTGSGLDSHEQNAAIGLVTSATASIMAGSCLVRWEVCGAMPELPGLTPHAYIPIDSNTAHVLVKTEAVKEYCETECCRHYTGRQPSCKRVATLETHVLVFFSKYELGPRLLSDMTGYRSYFRVI